jgi:hypothetical protein
MTPEPISTAYFILPSHQSVPVYVARQRLGKNVTAEMSTHAIEELLDVSFSMRIVAYQRKVDDQFSMRTVAYQRKVGDQFFPDLLVSLPFTILLPVFQLSPDITAQLRVHDRCYFVGHTSKAELWKGPHLALALALALTCRRQPFSLDGLVLSPLLSGQAELQPLHSHNGSLRTTKCHQSNQQPNTTTTLWTAVTTHAMALPRPCPYADHNICTHKCSQATRYFIC